MDRDTVDYEGHAPEGFSTSASTGKQDPEDLFGFVLAVIVLGVIFVGMPLGVVYGVYASFHERSVEIARCANDADYHQGADSVMGADSPCHMYEGQAEDPPPAHAGVL